MVMFSHNQQPNPLNISDQEWKEKLSESEYSVLRGASTERAFAHPSHNDKRSGEYRCKGCDTLLFSSEEKFDSGSGWPSFSTAVGPIERRVDRSIPFMKRVEILCGSCGGHLGHVFNDGPRSQGGERHCINGCALEFHSQTE